MLVCNYGYTAFGEQKTNCQDGGVWSHILADCRQGMSCFTIFEIMGLSYILYMVIRILYESSPIIQIVNLIRLFLCDDALYML